MHILDVRPMPAGMAGVARVDVELDDGVRLFNLTLKRAVDGAWRVWPPHAYSRSTASLPTNVAAAISAAAISRLRSVSPHADVAA